MMFEGKHIHFSPVDKKPLCSYSTKLCKQRRINGYAFCIRHILEDKSAPFKQCAHVARYNKQKCTNPIPSNENREFCNSHMQVAGMLPKKERKNKKEKEKELFIPCDGKLKFADRLRALLKNENSISCNDDPFNSDDPYAFPDTISEQENGCIGFSATPLLRTAWGCSQRVYSDSASSDSPSRGEQPVKNSISTDGKLKSNTPKLSKTMNRLHAKIAQNKILDKQKKTQDSSQNTMALTTVNYCPVTIIKTEPLSPVETCLSNESEDVKFSTNLIVKTESIKQEPHIHSSENERTETDSISSPHTPFPCFDSQPLRLNSCISPEPIINKSLSPSSDSSTKDQDFCNIKFEPEEENSISENKKVPNVLQEMHRIFKTKKRKSKDLVPLGFDSSESESSDSEEENHLLSQLSCFCAWDRRSSSTIENANSASRYAKQMQLKSELQRSYQQLCRLHTLHKQEIDCQKDLVQPLIDAARSYPDYATEILLNHTKCFSKKKGEKLIDVEKKNCCYRQDGGICNKPALPYTYHCRQHIMYNVDQLLYQHCTAKYPDNTQCCVPVFDISHELPLCDEHAKKRDNYQKLTLEPKPKKPRKKPKPSALTRPPKRGKKKKRPNLLRPASPLPLPPSPPSAPSNSSSNTKMQVSNHVTFGPELLKPVETVANAEVVPRDLNGQMDSELGSDTEEQLSPGAIEKSLDLPLDTAELANQATKLLEEHDFTEVLNKIPDDAFNDLFVDTRNGEYIPSTEETEELERALAAVSKDVHLAKVSLAKLSSGTGPDLEELERAIDIHGSLLGADNMTSAIDENTFPELTNVITSSFSTNDLNSLSQALSNIAAENIDQNHLPTVSDSHLIQNSVSTVPLLTSEVSHPHVLNGHTVTGVHPLHVDHNFSSHLLDNMNPGSSSDAPSDGRILGNSHHLAAILFGLGQASASAHPTTYSSSSNISEDTGLSPSGGLTSTHWLLNSSDQVLALSHMAYQNRFIVTSQGATPYTVPPLLASVGKYPLQALSAEVSLVSSNTPLVTSSCSDSVICGTTESPIPNVNLSSRPSLQQNSSATVIAQEGAS